MTDLVPLDEFDSHPVCEAARARARAETAAARAQPEPLVISTSNPITGVINDRHHIELCRLCHWGTSSGRCDHPGDPACPHGAG